MSSEELKESEGEGESAAEAEPQVSSSERHGPHIVALFSGKGGVGQSVLCANLGVYLAQTGKRVLLVDAKRWGRNLHTLLGLDSPPLMPEKMAEYAEHPRLEDLVLPTPFAELKLLSGASEAPSSATQSGCPPLITALRTGSYDLVLLDLPSWPSFSMFDHIIFADSAILVTVPEPTAMEGSWECLRGLYFRLFKLIEQKLEIGEVVERAMLSSKELELSSPKEMAAAIRFFRPAAGDSLQSELKRLKLGLIVNELRQNAEIELGHGIPSAYRRYFGLDMSFLGCVESDSMLTASVRQRKPLLTLQKDSKAARQIQSIAHKLLVKEAKDKPEGGK